MDYCPHTQADTADMLLQAGVGRVEELFSDIPDKFRLKKIPDMPPALSEQETAALLKTIGARNRQPRLTLTGAGAYAHYIPAVVGHLVGRAEFYTAYTPYQAELSQGILQAIYEYQTMMARLTGMDVANASMYDGASAMAEAAVLCARISNRNKLLIARSVHPEYREVVGAYCRANGYELEEIPFGTAGQLDSFTVLNQIDDTVAAVILQSPNFFGCLEDVEQIAGSARAKGALLIAGFTDGTALGIVKPAGECGADFVVGEGQSFGNPLNYGGPNLGVFAAREKYLRRIPGRLAGRTVDKNGRPGYVLTLQTREQHIRREKATSNICSNEALCALAAGIYLAALGKNLRKLALLNVYKAQYLKSKLLQLPGWKDVFSAPGYNEFVVTCPDAQAVNEKLEQEGIIGGYELAPDYPELESALLFCATELVLKEDIDQIVRILK